MFGPGIRLTNMPSDWLQPGRFNQATAFSLAVMSGELTEFFSID
jgi:hypothetical protein